MFLVIVCKRPTKRVILAFAHDLAFTGSIFTRQIPMFENEFGIGNFVSCLMSRCERRRSVINFLRLLLCRVPHKIRCEYFVDMWTVDWFRVYVVENSKTEVFARMHGVRVRLISWIKISNIFEDLESYFCNVVDRVSLKVTNIDCLKTGYIRFGLGLVSFSSRPSESFEPGLGYRLLGTSSLGLMREKKSRVEEFE